MLGSVGTYTWQGAAGTDFWVDSEMGLYGIILTQVLPGRYEPARDLRGVGVSGVHRLGRTLSSREQGLPEISGSPLT